MVNLEWLIQRKDLKADDQIPWEDTKCRSVNRNYVFGIFQKLMVKVLEEGSNYDFRIVWRRIAHN